MTRVLVAGVSTRAAAESAARAGFEVTAIDAYADRDQHPGVHAISVRRDRGVNFTAAAAARVAAEFSVDAVTYLSNFENDPEAVRTLSTRRLLWGTAPDVLRRVRDPFMVAVSLRDRGLSIPRVSAGDSFGDVQRWLIKPRASGGGHGVRAWRGEHVPGGWYLQELIEGIAGSVAFVATHGRAVPLAVSRQLIGDAAFGSSGYRYCGTILAAATDPQFPGGATLVRAAEELARTTAATFDLQGVSSIDFVARGSVPYPVEINPRWSSSMELVERAHGITVFAQHAMACAEGVLPHAPQDVHGAFGKAIVFARGDTIAGDTDAWLSNPEVRDVPRSGESFAAGDPVCTVFASAADAAACYQRLIANANCVYDQLTA